jgi:hypothetical protein
VVTAINHKRSYAIDHVARTVDTTGVMFWSLCGGHGDLVSATDGKTYFVTFECHEEPGVWAVDVSLAQTTADIPKQREDNRKLFATEWADDGHMAAGARGMFQDWAFISVESNDDPFTGGVSGWRPYKQEIVMANVVTGELRRLAHHRSRGIGASYYHQPRVSVSWDGTRVAWASNFGYAGTNYGDIYAIELGAAGSTPPPPPPPPPPTPATPTVTFSNPAAGATLSGNVTVTIGATGGSGDYTEYKLAVDGVNVYAGTNNTVSWNTTNVSNAAHTLKAMVTDSAGNKGEASRSVKVSNGVVTLPKVSFTAPAAGTTVSGTATVTLAASGGTGAGYTFTLAVDGVTVYSGTNKTIPWDTTAATDASHTLTATVTDSSGQTATVSRSVTVSNAAGALVATLTNPKAGTRLSGVVPIRMTVAGSVASTRTFTLFLNGQRMWTKTITGTSVSWNWDTGWWAEDGTHLLKLKVTDSAGKSDITKKRVSVLN